MITNDTRQLGAALLIDVEGKVNDLAVQYGLAGDRAKQFANAVAAWLADDWGGQQVYVSMDFIAKNKERNAAIYTDFTGDNHAHLASKYGLSLQAVYRIIKVEREARAQKQHTLF